MNSNDDLTLLDSFQSGCTCDSNFTFYFLNHVTIFRIPLGWSSKVPSVFMCVIILTLASIKPNTRKSMGETARWFYSYFQTHFFILVFVSLSLSVRKLTWKHGWRHCLYEAQFYWHWFLKLKLEFLRNCILK